MVLVALVSNGFKDMFAMKFVSRKCMQMLARGRWNKYSLAAKERAMEFITNYAGVFGLPITAAPCGRANTAPTYLPSSCTFQSVWTLYYQAQQGDEETMGYHTLLRLRHRKLPSILIMSPRIDVCARCERLQNEMRNAGSEQDKLQTAYELKSHVELAHSERDFYKSCISRSKTEPDTFFHVTLDFAETFGPPYHARILQSSISSKRQSLTAPTV